MPFYTYFQRSISRPSTCYGIGVHSGLNTQLTLKPAKADTGIVFIRTDVPQEYSYIPVRHDKVSDTTLSTTLVNEYGVKVSTVEHLTAALWAYGIDNLIIELDGSEVPIMDGSSRSFIFMLECSGVIEQKAPRKYTLIKKDMEVSDGDKSVVVIPQTNIEVNLTIDFTSKAIGKQNIEYSHNRESFRNDIADARTFGFIHELDYLKRKGLGLGASLDNAVGIDGDTVLNPEGLRYRDEFVRHKLLDMLGDIYIASHVIGRFEAIKTGHGLNNLLLNKILSDASNYEFVDASSINDRLSNS